MAAASTALPFMKVARLPQDPRSYGVRSVSWESTLMSLRRTPSSSAAICAIAVCAPWPMSSAEVISVTVPSSESLMIASAELKP